MYKRQDSELRQLAVAGDTAAEEELIERYAKLVRICARPYFLAGGDSEDLTQEGMLGLLSAIRNYDESGGASFRTFAEICICLLYTSFLLKVPLAGIALVHIAFRRCADTGGAGFPGFCACMYSGIYLSLIHILRATKPAPSYALI